MPFVDTAVLSFNCGRELVDPAVLAGHLVQALGRRPAPELLVLSLQEVAPIARSFLGGGFLAPYLQRFVHAVALAGAQWSVPASARDSAEPSPDGPYALLAAHNVGMTAVLAFARGDRAGLVRSVRAAGVGVGWLAMGNKGCVGVRLGYGDDDFTFLAAHLAPMEWNTPRRNDDWRRIVEGLVFTPSAAAAKGSAGSEERQRLLGDGDEQAPAEAGIYDTTSWVFVAGDLNYRTSDTAPAPEDSAAFRTLVESVDKRDKLLKKDQLSREIGARKTLHGFAELPIDFAPTYKHSPAARMAAKRREEAAVKAHESAPADDLASSATTEWSRHRWPSWCDRVLFLHGGRERATAERDINGATLLLPMYKSLPLLSSSDHQPVLFVAELPLGLAINGQAEKTPYPIDPSWRSSRDAARWREIAVGLAAYLGVTWEGNAIVLATVFGALGGWALIQSLLVE